MALVSDFFLLPFRSFFSAINAVLSFIFSSFFIKNSSDESKKTQLIFAELNARTTRELHRISYKHLAVFFGPSSVVSAFSVVNTFHSGGV